MNDMVMQRFRRFKEMFVSSNVPNNILLELIESYLISEDNEETVNDVPIIDGQLSLFDMAA